MARSVSKKKRFDLKVSYKWKKALGFPNLVAIISDSGSSNNF